MTRSAWPNSATSRSSTGRWSGFQNFAISFTIISILAGCFTTYGQAFNNGGPIAISWGWPLISIPILIIGFCMSELVSAYPTAGGIYWWASKLGGAAWGWFTGWFNLIGLVAVTASVAYGSATFLNTVFGLFDFNLFQATAKDPHSFLRGTFVLFVVIMVLHAVINIAGSHLVARVNGVSVWWHVSVSRSSSASSSSCPTSTQARTSSSPSGSTTRASATACSGSTCCPSASC